MRIKLLLFLLLVTASSLFFPMTMAKALQYPSTLVFHHDKSNNSLKRRAALMVLVSSSIPIASVHRYLVDARKVHGTLVLRGLVNHSFQATGQWVRRVLMQTKGGISIDPIVFEKLQITQVPTIILFNKKALACLNQKNCVPDQSDVDTVTGNVTLAYALKEMRLHGTADIRAANLLLTQLREADHD